MWNKSSKLIALLAFAGCGTETPAGTDAARFGDARPADPRMDAGSPADAGEFIGDGGGAADAPSLDALAPGEDASQPAIDGGDTGMPPVGAMCPNDPFVCARDQGCVDGFCGACRSAFQCRSLDACRADGTCGECQNSGECRSDEECRRGFCLPGAPPIWDLRVTPANFARLESNPDADIFVPCGLTAGGVAYDRDCMVRLRGGSSRAFPKRSFRIEFPENADHPGFTRKINLRAEYNDDSFLRNYLAHESFRRFTERPAPATRFIRLTLNGREYGLMLEVERIGGRFLERHGRDRDRSMYEADPSGELHTNGATALIPLPDVATYRAAFDQTTGTRTDYSDLIAFIEQAIWPDWIDSASRFPTRTTRIRTVLDVDGYLDYLAVYGVIQSSDHVKKNYYLSLQPDSGGTPRWEFYPWDMDLSFGCLWNVAEDNSICNTLETEFPNDIGGLSEGDMVNYPTELFFNLLIHLVVGDTQLRGRHQDRICAIVRSDFWTRRLPSLIDALEETIRDAVAADPNDRNRNPAEFRAAVQTVRSFHAMRTTFLGADCP